MEILFTVIYLLEDFPTRADFYQKAGWREHLEEFHKYRTEYAKRPEWKPFFHNYKKMLEQGAQEFEITESEANDPHSIEYWKTGYQLIDRMGPTNKPFGCWVNTWFYHEISAIAHFDPYGVAKTAMFLVESQAGEKERKFIESEALPRFRAFHISITIMIIVALVSEFEHAFKLNNREPIVKVWKTLRHAIPDAEEMCVRRYDQMLSVTPDSLL